MAVVKALMRFFSYIFHGLLALFLMAISAMALATGMHSLHLDMLPWTGASLTYWLFGLSMLGMFAVGLALKRVLPLLFFVWSLGVFVILVKGYIFSGHYFDPGELKTALCLILAALVSVVGAWTGLKQRPARA